MSALTITPLHLSVGRTLENGDVQRLHVIENGDIGVILKHGRNGGGQYVASGDTATLVVSLGVDGEHDEVAYERRATISDLEAITQAIAALETAKEALELATR